MSDLKKGLTKGVFPQSLSDQALDLIAPVDMAEKGQEEKRIFQAVKSLPDNLQANYKFLLT